ncbi:MAG: hypothetical protein ACI4VF_03950 [Lachnospirales bacterium]
MRANKNTYTAIITAISIFFNLIILIFPEKVINSVKWGLLLWYNQAIPSLLPFIISINILKRTKAPLIFAKILNPISEKIFKISGMGNFPIIMGMLSGYPLGAKLTCELYLEKKITKKEASHLLLFTNNSGPLFILGTVGTMFLNNKILGITILLIHYLSAIILGIITTPNSVIKNNEYLKPKYYSLSDIISETIENSIDTIVKIGGYIILFSIITSFIMPFFKNPLLKGVIYAIFEMTGGCNLLSKEGVMGVILLSAFISWGGLSVHAQSLGYITKTDLQIKPYFTAKIIQSFITLILTTIAIIILKKLNLY